MVDALVSFAVQKLDDFLRQQARLRFNLKKDLQNLETQLRFMQAFLKDAEEKQVEDHSVQLWVFEIKSLADDAVAILETYNFVAGEGDGHGFASRLKTCACICRKETKFYNVSKEIQSLNERIEIISKNQVTYGIRAINNVEGPNNYRPNNQTSGWRRTTSYMEKREQNFVGFKEVVEKLHAELVNAELRRTVISIYGMGGSGKTTLAKHLYHSPRLTNIFSARGWVCVSQQYNITDLLKNVIRSIKEYDNETVDWLEKMTDVTVLERRLQNLLKDEKYLVVVDDVWQTEAWESLERAFPDSNKGSRVIITTRKEHVAKRADDNCLAQGLRPLTEEESWVLFRRKLLNFKVMIPAMETLARDMVRKCEGLPLAIAALSGLLSYKNGLEEWERVKEHLWNHVKTDCKEISGVLSLSYNDLSTVLKHCFLYFGIFPEDRQIDAKNLMWLWMADGLIPRGEAERMEDVAQDILDELIRRSLVQVVETFWEEVYRCRIHDLLRDLAIQKALEVNFSGIYGPRKHSISSSCRRHTINGQGERMETLMRHLPVSGQEGVQKLKKIAARFEEKNNTAATSRQDYMRKIAIKMLTMETKSQNPNAHGAEMTTEAASYETISGPEESDEVADDGDVSKEDGLEEVVVMEEQKTVVVHKENAKVGENEISCGLSSGAKLVDRLAQVEKRLEKMEAHSEKTETLLVDINENLNYLVKMQDVNVSRDIRHPTEYMRSSWTGSSRLKRKQRIAEMIRRSYKQRRLERGAMEK